MREKPVKDFVNGASTDRGENSITPEEERWYDREFL
jgi:hypothetical protein